MEFSITGVIAYHLHLVQLKTMKKRGEGLLGGEPPRSPALRHNVPVLRHECIVTPFKLRVHRGCRRHRRRRLRCHPNHRYRDQIDRSMGYRH